MPVFDFLELVRFSADMDDSFDPHLSSAQQPNGLLAAGLSLRIRALRAGIEFILAPAKKRCKMTTSHAGIKLKSSLLPRPIPRDDTH
jgi:hypothetical protein